MATSLGLFEEFKQFMEKNKQQRKKDYEAEGEYSLGYSPDGSFPTAFLTAKARPLGARIRFTAPEAKWNSVMHDGLPSLSRLF